MLLRRDCRVKKHGNSEGAYNGMKIIQNNVLLQWKKAAPVSIAGVNKEQLWFP